ncbi:hypothetical protein K2Z83_06600 [Oscillochloris sp. ZM17-4]|uniref:hypothetical protein n=1 Tax=Oscillochloris sp. ZM17-4 TaxID=2866714 RepID=UPI001C73D3AA|nr:hypothetical protein [Oscillochloris sp. ZM17-4]MBX0327344.1 hypothetical protein [Oscillochloris sp. ZM17-4]
MTGTEIPTAAPDDSLAGDPYRPRFHLGLRVRVGAGEQTTVAQPGGVAAGA